MNQLLELIQQERRFLLSGHTNPDGDCLGAQVALHHLLVTLGRESHIVNPDPAATNIMRLLGDAPIQDFRTTRSLPEFDVLVLLDCAELTRLGDMADRVRAVDPTIAVIDHHVDSEHGDGQVNYVDVQAAATGAMVYELYKSLGVDVSQPAAQAIFLSLVSDTGWFRYSNTDARTLAMASELIASGVRPDHVFDELYRRNDSRTVAFLSSALANHSFRLDGRLVLAVLDRAAMEQAGRIGFDTDALLEPIRSVAGVEVAVLFKELFSGGVKISLRATGDVNVQAIAKVFGGGGHMKAAGATLNMDMDQSVAEVEQEVSKALALEGNEG